MRIKLKRYLLRIDFWVFVTSLLLVRTPVAFGFRQNPVVRLLFLLPLLLIAAKNLILTFFKFRFRFNKTLLILFLFLSIALIIAFLRTAVGGLFPASLVVGNLSIWVTVAVFSFGLFVTAPNEQTAYAYRRGIFFALSLYMVVNVVLHFIGFRSPEVVLEKPVIAALIKGLGITSFRILFPLAGGLNTIGAAAGIYLIAGAIILTRRDSPWIDRISAVLGGLCSSIILLLTDSRGALTFAAATILAYLFLPKRYYSWLRWLPLLTPLLPLVALIVLQHLPETVIIALSRSGSDFANMSNRLEIWDLVLKELSQFNLGHLIGFGYRGQVASGLSQSYAYLFTSYTESGIATAHNYLLQSILEIGYVGTAILVALLTAMIGKLVRAAQANRFDYTPKAMLFVLVYLVLIGTTEAIFSPDFQEVFTIFLAIWAASGTMGLALWPRRMSKHG